MIAPSFEARGSNPAMQEGMRILKNPSEVFRVARIQCLDLKMSASFDHIDFGAIPQSHCDGETKHTVP